MCLQLSVKKTVYSSTFGGVALISAENSMAAGDPPANMSSAGPRTTLHIPSARATIPVHASLRRRFTATCAAPKPSLHSPMAGSTEGCTATAVQQKNVKSTRYLHFLLSIKSTAKRRVAGRIRNRAAYLSSEIRAANSTPTFCTEGWIKTTWNRAYTVAVTTAARSLLSRARARAYTINRATTTRVGVRYLSTTSVVSRPETRERAACSSNHPLTLTRDNSATFSPK